MTHDSHYRLCAGIVLTNANGLIFTGERIDTPGAWQMPQGGIDNGEAPRDAALRELEEETGLSRESVSIEAEHPDWITYDLPEDIAERLWKGRYRGQAQKWFLLRYTGPDRAIDIAKHDREFAQWRWSHADDVLRDIVPFKQDVYVKVIAAFRDLL